MKMQQFRSLIGKLFIGIATTAGLLLVSPERPAVQAAAPVPCEPINTELDGQLFPCSDSPVGMCAVGTVRTGSLKGSKEAIYLGASFSAGMPNAEPASTLSYAANQVFRTEKGDLHVSVVGVSDNLRLVFTEVARITGGTGRFTNATGDLFISGTLSPDGSGFQSKVSGAICFDPAR